MAFNNLRKALTSIVIKGKPKGNFSKIKRYGINMPKINKFKQLK